MASSRSRRRETSGQRPACTLPILLLGLLLFLITPRPVAGNENKEIAYVYGTDSHGVTRQLAADRTPALYTSDFGDCLGGKSLFNITVFDAAYYADNMTVVFHLDGTSRVNNESTMVIITMQAYGETRYTQTFDPCLVNMWDLCPLNWGVPVTVYGSFALVPLQTAAIPDIALQIPDFDGSVSLQIFANSTQTEIGCFQAAMTNGNSLGIPDILGPTIAFFAAIAIICSFFTASYGISVPLMRAHYAHSLSVVLILETLQTIFLTGALSLHWPSVLVAWWSNFAWSVGLIDITPLVAHIGSFTGVTSNTSLARISGPMFTIGGGSQLADQIYGEGAQNNGPVLAATAYKLFQRKVYNSSDPYDYTWGGDPVLPGGKNRGITRRISYLDDDEDRQEKTDNPGIHQDDAYIKRFGWLSARYRAGCFWFFAVHLGTQLARACILGGGADNVSSIDPNSGSMIDIGSPTAQLVVLLLFEISAMCLYAYWRPFESSRNNILGVWVLGFGRTLVAALCIGLLPQIGISRIGATVVGFAIIVVQVLMLAVIVVLVAMDVISTWLSLTRNQDDFHSEMFFTVRKRYLETLLANATGAPPPPTRRQQKKQEKAAQREELEAERIAASLPPPAPSFSVIDVRRTPKIEDVHYADSDGDSEIEGSGLHGYFSTHDRQLESGQSRSSRGGSDTTGPAHNNNTLDLDTLGDLGDLMARASKRWRDTGSGSSASLVGAQIYDPARVIARLNRSRTNSAASLRSVPSAQDSIRRVSEMTAFTDLSGPPQIGVLVAGRRSASPFGGGRASPYSNRSSSVPPVRRTESALSLNQDGLDSAAGTLPRRMTPTRETLQRYSAERQSLQSMRSKSTPMPYPVPE
ncbi:hypothetical protein SEUCBS140593_010785 [Sporothrix eucalyptigena]|uniref:ML-like domain-containing protein n=1 Tax=Sporothrix eucalyptigena TaxID=1812306 RepID=A0ABP0D293_9PEZI